MHTSPKGIAFLESHEGVVLKAYRCPAGILTIGTGITSASGVIKVTAGMTITRQQASDLLAKALRRTYEPRVAKAMPKAKQHEFDGGVSFDFNTGAIDRASWVKNWAARQWDAMRVNLSAWKKGGGKVLPGLVRRRAEEYEAIRYDRWPTHIAPTPATLAPYSNFAVFVVTVTAAEILEIRKGFAAVGFEPGGTPGQILRASVEAFQAKYDLTVDGKIGRATLSTLQRELDARAKSAPAAIAGPAGAAMAGGNEVAGGITGDAAADALITWIGGGAIALAALYGLWLAWRYRDMVAARLNDKAPHLAGWLRSV